MLDFRVPIMGSLKSLCPVYDFLQVINRDRSSKLLSFEKIVFLHSGDRQTNKQTNRWTRTSHEAALVVVSDGLITLGDRKGIWLSLSAVFCHMAGFHHD